MNTKSLSAAEAKTHFERVLRQIDKTGGPIIVEQDGKAVVVILSVSEYQRIQPKAIPDEEQLGLLKEAFGLWSQRADIDEEWLADGRSRWESV